MTTKELPGRKMYGNSGYWDGPTVDLVIKPEKESSYFTKDEPIYLVTPAELESALTAERRKGEERGWIAGRWGLHLGDDNQQAVFPYIDDWRNSPEYKNEEEK